MIAYFSMEIGLQSSLPLYSGGLGVLAGDTAKTAADLGVPFVAVSLMYHYGYFRQSLDADGSQREEPEQWHPALYLELTPASLEVSIEGKMVKVAVWRYDARGAGGRTVPVLLLDTKLPGNAPEHTGLTDSLYGGDRRYRLAQEILLGFGGIAALEALGYRPHIHHMNEGHSALLTVALLERSLAQGADFERAVSQVRERTVFTTHTPVAAGHDIFGLDLARAVLGDTRTGLIQRVAPGGTLHMTELALALSGRTNAVSKEHQRVSAAMFPGRKILAITNGVHPESWTSAPFSSLFDRWTPGWRTDATLLSNGDQIPLHEISAAHNACKARLIERISAAGISGFSTDPFTIGFARRATGYKRLPLVLSNIDRLAAIARRFGGLQFVFAGKAHPHDFEGKELIRQLHERYQHLPAALIRAVYLPDYNMDEALAIVSGVDIWLNTPRPPLEASGTSGMKAALNAVPHLSTIDGWWKEGLQPGITGWAVGSEAAEDDAAHAESLYQRLEHEILPIWAQGDQYLVVRRNAIARCGSYFNSHRMFREYQSLMYLDADPL